MSIDGKLDTFEETVLNLDHAALAAIQLAEVLAESAEMFRDVAAGLRKRGSMPDAAREPLRKALNGYREGFGDPEKLAAALGNFAVVMNELRKE